MSDHDKQEQQRKADGAELGYVESVNDLQPDSQVGPSRKAKEQQRIVNPSAVGYFETEGGSAGGLGAPLHLGPELKKDGGSLLTQYEVGYNQYAVPLRSTYRAMGRLKDVSLTGAPMTPAELMQRPELAARFRKLSLTHGDVAADQAFDSWSTQQTKMNLDVQRFGAGQVEMAGAIADFRAAQALLARRRSEAQRSAKTAELREIEETAETLTRIVEVSVESWSAMGTIEEAIDAKVALDESAEGVDAMAGIPKGGINWVSGTGEDKSGETQSTKSRRQKGADAVATLGTQGTMATAIAREAREQLQKSGRFELSLKDLITKAVGGTKYDDLQRDVILLGAQIKKLDLDRENDLVEGATRKLSGFKMEFVARRLDVQADRAAARKGARTFAKTMGGGADAITSMYAAEAYQELAAFGELAAEQRQSMVDPVWGAAHRYIHGYDKHRFLAIGAADDAVRLDENLNAVREQRSFLTQHVPEWQQIAKQWSDFLGARTNSPLVTEENEADIKSRAP